MANGLITSAAGLLTLVTVLPLSKATPWWIRGWDFPRLQLAIGAVILLVAELVWLQRDGPLAWATVTVTGLCLIYHALWILPYTPVFRREVRSTPPDSAAPRLRLLAANVLTPNRRAAEFLEQVHRHRPDVLVTVETDEWWEQQLEANLPGHPYVLRCPLDNLYGMHVFSRFPIEDARIQFLVERDIPSMHMLIALPCGRRIRLHCLHPAPPSPTENETSKERDAELVMVGRALAGARLPVIVTGDLNDVAWSVTTRLFRKISGLLDPRVGRGMYNTFHSRFPFFRWPVDHVFHSDDFTLVDLRRLPAGGSDHFPMFIELALGDPRAHEQTDEGLELEPEDEELAAEKQAEEGVTPAAVHQPGERRRAVRR